LERREIIIIFSIGDLSAREKMEGKFLFFPNLFPCGMQRGFAGAGEVENGFLAGVLRLLCA
jgi:hypothetical protein